MLSAAITLVKPELDATLWLSHLLVHMIADHGFFGYASGSPRSRVEPLDIALILGLVDKDTHAAITTGDLRGIELEGGIPADPRNHLPASPDKLPRPGTRVMAFKVISMK